MARQVLRRLHERELGGFGRVGPPVGVWHACGAGRRVGALVEKRQHGDEELAVRSKQVQDLTAKLASTQNASALEARKKAVASGMVTLDAGEDVGDILHSKHLVHVYVQRQPGKEVNVPGGIADFRAFEHELFATLERQYELARGAGRRTM